MSLMSEVVQITDESAWEFQQIRESADAAILKNSTIKYHLGAIDIFERLKETEGNLFPNGDYVNGSAQIPNEVLILEGLGRVLITAEHAAQQMRLNKKGVREPKEADMGTGALAMVTAFDSDNTALVAMGRQTGDANSDVGHVFKSDYIKPQIARPHNRAHISLHMLDRGRAAHPREIRGYSIMLGLGPEPSQATKALADFLIEAGSDYDLRVGVNQPHIRFGKKGNLRRNEDGTLKTVTFAAAGPGTTRTFSQSEAQQLGKGEEYAAMQVEINEVLLVAQNDEVAFPSQADREAGAYLGYLFAKRAVQAVDKL